MEFQNWLITTYEAPKVADIDMENQSGLSVHVKPPKWLIVTLGTPKVADCHICSSKGG